MSFLELAQKRYSCKKYSDRKIDRVTLTRILEAGRLAPTAKNLQEQHIFVAESPEALKKIDETTPCRYNAPTVLIVAFDKENVYTYPRRQTPVGNRRRSHSSHASHACRGR